MAELIWTESAKTQLAAIIDFISLDKPETAIAVLRKVVTATDQLERFIRMGRPIPEYRQRNYRQVWIKPCWIYYHADNERIIILHVRRAEKLLHIQDLF